MLTIVDVRGWGGQNRGFCVDVILEASLMGDSGFPKKIKPIIIQFQHNTHIWFSAT